VTVPTVERGLWLLVFWSIDIAGEDVGQITKDGKFSINTLRCVGTCALAPVIMVGEKVYGNVAPGDAKKIVSEYQKEATRITKAKQ